MIRTCMLLLLCFGQIHAQLWSIEPMLGTRFDWNRVQVVQGDIQTEPHRSLSFGVEVNRHPHPRLHQGIGFSRQSFSNSYVVEGTYSNLFRLGSAFYFANALTFHHTYQFVKIQRYEFEAGVGGQLFFTKQMSGQGGGLGVGQFNPLSPFDVIEQYSGKRGISPVVFGRLNMRYRIRPYFSTFIRTQLNVGTRALYTTNVAYEGQNTEGSALIKNRGTGVLFAFGMRYDFERKKFTNR